MDSSRLDHRADTGELVGNYRITGKLGEGGMGAVYAAEHAILGRRAAIKVLRTELSHRQDLVTRFFNEARAATAVKHPGIVEIYDFGYHADGSAFIVMEYLEGESLSARLRRTGGLDEARAVAMGRQVARALAAAHAKGIVHRDLKPDNIFIVADPDVAGGERTKILDFGIAKLSAVDGLASSVTSTGMVMGTPTYMAPEQCKGAGKVDHRADVYALGCIVFEMVCGRPPFVAEGAGELMAQHIFGEVPRPSSIRPISTSLEQALLRALAKEPDQRFASADELIAAIQPGPSGAYPYVTGAPEARTIAASTGLLPHAVPPRTTLSTAAGPATMSAVASPRRRGALLAGGVAVLALGAAVAFVATCAARGGEAAERAAPAAPVVAAAPVPVPAANAHPPAVAPVVAPPAPAAAPPVAPAPITVHVSSQPAGADVYLLPEGVRIGTTPLDHAMAPVDGEVVLIVKKAGYLDRQVAVRADHDGDVTVPLAKQPADHPHGGTRPPPDPHAPPDAAGTSGAGSLDPFDRMGAKP